MNSCSHRKQEPTAMVDRRFLSGEIVYEDGALASRKQSLKRSQT